MRLALTQDQTMLSETAASFAAHRSPLSRAHKMRHGREGLGYSAELWTEMANLGWLGIPFAADDGGAGLGVAEAVIVTEALGRSLVPEPFVPVVMLAGQALALAGTSQQRAEWLQPLVEGKAVVAFAHQERATRHDPHRVACRAHRVPGGYRISGEKVHVTGGNGASAFIVVSRTSGKSGDREGLTLLVVPSGTPGLRVTPQARVDSRNAARLELEGVEVDEASVIGQPDGGTQVLEQVLDRATVALCGEMLGAMSEAFERTLAYVKERRQFGVAVGSFQALKHRLARVFVEIELSRSAVMAAARGIDEGAEHRRLLVSTAKARCNDAYRLAANEAVQLHGGIGMTDEHEIGLFLKHAAATSMTLGDSTYHRDRFARACGF